MTVNLTGVADAQDITVNLNGVTDSFGQSLSPAAITLTTLIGDVNGNRSVNGERCRSSEISSNAPVDGSNFRADVNANGSINGTDVALVKASTNHRFPNPTEHHASGRGKRSRATSAIRISASSKKKNHRSHADCGGVILFFGLNAARLALSGSSFSLPTSSRRPSRCNRRPRHSLPD